MMIEVVVVSILSGSALGMMFFGGLWWTVQKGLVAKVPAAWFLLSFLVRMALAILGFYWISQFGDWLHLSIALLSFIISRMVLTRIVPSPLESTNAS